MEFLVEDGKNNLRTLECSLKDILGLISMQTHILAGRQADRHTLIYSYACGHTLTHK